MPDASFELFIVVIVLAIGFGIVNGFNDAANAIAAAIGTRALAPRTALAIAVVANFAGAATGTAVAHTIGKGIIIQDVISYQTIIAALISIIIWGTIATWMGLPISIHHGFIAGLAAAGMAIAGNAAVVWSVMQRVLSAVIIAPTLGFIGGFIIMLCLYWIFQKSAPDQMRRVFSRLQWISTFFMAYSHGKNDGQMPIGVITMALVIHYNDTGIWEHLSLLSPETWWVIVVSASAISFGVALGGRRVVRTIGMRMTALRPVQGFSTHLAAATVIETASHLGIPVSTTHCVSASVMGVGSTRRFSAVRWGIAGNIVAAWILTFPICGIIGYVCTLLLGMLF
ncbi:MAG TPA: inorganic phosphate transporter [Dehalococcoidia bacterium]|nr:inorganic phosphate transporter [Dehalococcoidia bacterium]